MSNDFRIIPPIKRYSKFYEEDVFVIPTRVIRIGNKKYGSTFSIEIEILDFYNAERIMVSGITYRGSLQYFSSVPFETECIVRNLDEQNYELIVYNNTNTGLIERLFGVREILNNDETEILDIYNHNYTELRKWIGSRTKYKPIDNTDLPF